MAEISKRASLVEDVAHVLYGDGAWEYIAKMGAPNAAHQDRKKRLLTAGLSAVGATAGAAGLGYAGAKFGGAARKGYKATQSMGKLRKIGSAVKAGVKEEPVGSALVPLEVAGLGGEVMATKILHGDTQKKQTMGPKPKVIAKMSSGTQAALKAAGMGTGAAAVGGGLAIGGVALHNKRAGRKWNQGAPRRKVTKSADGQLKDVPPKQRLTKIAVDQGFKAAKAAPEVAKNTKQNARYAGYTAEYVARRAVRKQYDVTFRGEISKMDTDKRQVFGWASIIEMDGKPVVDLQGDIMTLEVIEKAAYDYVKTSRKGGNQHSRDGVEPRHVSDMIESFLVTDEKKQQMGLPDSVPTGWWVGFQVNDEPTWQQVKDGKLKEFSIHGSGIRKELLLED